MSELVEFRVSKEGLIFIRAALEMFLTDETRNSMQVEQELELLRIIDVIEDAISESPSTIIIYVGK